MKSKSAILITVFEMLVFYSSYSTAQSIDTDKIGNSTQAWLAMQANGSAAAVSQPMPGAQASAAYTRYLKSFDKPIPDAFESSLKNAGSQDKSSGG
jgi:hypothetical protein